MFNVKVFKERLRSAREEAGLNQEEFAKKAGIARASASYYENPKNASLPNIETLYNIAEVLGVSYDYLLGKSENLKRENIAIGEELGMSDRLINVFRTYKELLDERNPNPLRTGNAFNYQILEALLTSQAFSKIVGYITSPAFKPDGFLVCTIHNGDEDAWANARGEEVAGWEQVPGKTSDDIAPVAGAWIVDKEHVKTLLLEDVADELDKIRKELYGGEDNGDSKTEDA